MAVQSADKPKLVRGTHAERSASMRKRVIEAAVHCLHSMGYAATTTQQVMETAAVSRGAMLHHFPTKVDLMLAVAQFAAKNQDRMVRQCLGEVPPGIDRYLALTTATWGAMSHPSALALLEIMMATRSDPVLAERLPAFVAAFQAEQGEAVWRLASELGIDDRQMIGDMVRLHTAAMRGLAIELALTGQEEAAGRSMQLLVQYKKLITGGLLTGSWTVEAKRPKPAKKATDKTEGA